VLRDETSCGSIKKARDALILLSHSLTTLRSVVLPSFRDASIGPAFPLYTCERKNFSLSITWTGRFQPPHIRPRGAPRIERSVKSVSHMPRSYTFLHSGKNPHGLH
jgi:hypothetical protein